MNAQTPELLVKRGLLDSILASIEMCLFPLGYSADIGNSFAHCFFFSLLRLGRDHYESLG